MHRFSSRTRRYLGLTTIRSRLFFAFVLMTLLPALAFATVSTVVGYRSGRQQVIEQLESVATIKEAELNTWVKSLEGEVATAAASADASRSMRELLSAEADDADRMAAYQKLHQWFEQVVEQSPRLDELLLLDLDTRVVLSTQWQNEGRFGGPGSQLYFPRGLRGEYLSPPSYTMLVGDLAVMAVRPVLDENGQALGVLGGRAGPSGLSEIMSERTGLGETGETYLVTTSHVMLTEPRFPRDRWSTLEYVFTEGAHYALEEVKNGSGAYSNYRGQRVLGVYHWLPDLQLALLAEQWEAEAMSPVYANLGANLGVAVVAVLLAGTVSMLLARSIVVPLGELARTAQRVAEGDFGHSSEVVRPDEIGALAQAYNTMTARLRELIATLEERVRERTEDLQSRALQLETSARVSREITSILDVDQLLKQVVEVIKAAFGYYHVRIFLMDEEANGLVLGAGTGQAVEHWTDEGTHLTVESSGLNGQVAQTGEPLIAGEVHLEPGYLQVGVLPLTGSQLVVPLRIGRRVIGTLDVQSTELNAFAQEDVRLIQSLADQVAVAIENARLYERSQSLAVLEERQRLARELHDSLTQALYSTSLFAEAARREMNAGDPELVHDYLDQLTETAQQALKQMRLLVYELRPAALDREGLVGALSERLRLVERRLGIETHLGLDGEIELAPHEEEALYRIAEEALNNALKHADASSVSVLLEVVGHGLRLAVTDDGRGFDPHGAHDGGGMGLSTMRERAQGVGAELSIVSSPGRGTTVRVELEVGS
jgi:nitrate/nitrite-specific signal transduction histidine kinase